MYSRTFNPSGRVEKWVLRLQAYNFKVVYCPGQANIADALSRRNKTYQRDISQQYDFVRSVVEASVPLALMPKEVEHQSAADPELKEIKRCVQTIVIRQMALPQRLNQGKQGSLSEDNMCRQDFGTVAVFQVLDTHAMDFGCMEKFF